VKTAGQRYHIRKLKKLAVIKEGDFVGVLRAANDVAKRHLKHWVGEAQKLMEAGNQEGADKAYEAASKLPPRGEFKYVGMVTKKGKLMDPNTLRIIGDMDPHDLLYPFKAVLEMTKNA
jgi:hypothetical protein